MPIRDGDIKKRLQRLHPSLALRDALSWRTQGPSIKRGYARSCVRDDGQGGAVVSPQQQSIPMGAHLQAYST